MKKIIIKFLHIIYGGAIIGLSLLLLPFAKLFLGRKKIWIVSERPTEARDNGLVFYNYLLTHHPEINCFYAIDTSSKDFSKIKGKFLQFGSLKHIFYFAGCKISMSSTIECLAPNSYLLKFQNKIGYPHKNVFLQHGIILNDLSFLHRCFNRIDLFICGAEPEFNVVSKDFGYSKNQVVYTGLARFDNYFDYSTKNQILVMPTWRRGADNGDIQNSLYFKKWTEFLKSKKLYNMLEKNDLHLFFYMHPVFAKYIRLFQSTGERIVIAQPDVFDIQTLFKESKVLITDYSSILFDFGFMKKPSIYYQFDQKYFFDHHYKKGYFSYESDSFGYLTNNIDGVLSTLNCIISDNFIFEKRFLENHNRFFKICDNKNCERIYNCIIRL